jgi:hypothetical protein
MREALQTRHYSIRTEHAYGDWAKRFILFHQKGHPKASLSPAVSAARLIPWWPRPLDQRRNNRGR